VCIAWKGIAISVATRETARAVACHRVRLCVLIPSHWTAVMGGSEYQVQVLMEHLLSRNDVELFFVTNRVAEGFEARGYELVRIAKQFGVRRYGLFFDAPGLYRILRRLKPDVIYQVIGSAHTGIAAFYARRHRCKLVFRVTDEMSLRRSPISWRRPHHRLERVLLHYGIRHATTIVAQTEAQRRLLAEQFGRRDAVIVRNFHPLPTETARKDRTKKRVLWIANLKRLKQPDVFLRLAARFAGRSDVEFVMLGGPADDPVWVRSIEREIDAHGNVHYEGRVSPAEVNERLAGAHLLVNTSTTEGFSNTFIQAWAREVPVVSLTVDPDGVFSSSSPSLLAGSEQRLGDLVARLLDDDELRAQIAARCRRVALEQYTEANAERLVELLVA
jgi:glycosyltransferase involved in cell wall biosynthesis